MRIRIEWEKEEKTGLINEIKESIPEEVEFNEEDLENKVGNLNLKLGKVEYDSERYIDIELAPKFTLDCSKIICKYFDVVKVLSKMVIELITEWFVDNEEESETTNVEPLE